MPLQRQQIDVSLSAGLDQKADPKSLAVQGAVQMTNCVRLKSGAIRKRYGHAALTQSVTGGYSSPTKAVAGGNYRGAPWMTDGSIFYEYSDGAAAWSVLDVAPKVTVMDRIGVSTVGTLILETDSAASSSFIHVVHTAAVSGVAGNTSLYMTVLDALTGAVIVPTFRIVDGTATSVQNPHAIVCGTSTVVAYQQGAFIKAITYTTGTATVGVGPVTIDGVFTSPFDVVGFTGDPTRVIFGYERGSGSIHVVSYTAAGLVGIHSQDYVVTANTCSSIAMRATSAETIWLTYTMLSTAAPTLYCLALNDDAPFSVKGTERLVFTWPTGSTNYGRHGVEKAGASGVTAFLTWGTQAATVADAWTAATNVTISGGAIVSSSPIYYTGGVNPLSRPRSTGTGVASVDKCYIGVYTVSQTQGSTFLAVCDGYGFSSSDTHAVRPVATFAPRLNKPPISVTGPLACTSLVQLPNTTTSWGMLTLSNVSVKTQALFLERFDVSNIGAYASADLYETQALAAGVPSLLSGNAIAELGWPFYPELAVTAGGAGTGSLSAGVYQYVGVYEQYDGRGQLHRSATSPPVSVTVVNTGSGVVVFPVPSFTSRRTKYAPGFTPGGATTGNQSPVVMAIYRTQANGTIFYRVTSDPATAGAQAPLAVSTITAATKQNAVTFTDTASDVSISTSALLYTTGGILDNMCPPASRCVVAHKGRWWLGGCDDPTQLWPSKAITPGECPGFNEAMNFTCSGAIRALASMDDKLVVFVQRGAANGVEFISGDGPGDAGTMSDWLPPQPVPSDTGAVDQRSTCTGPFGVFFRGTQGGPNGTGGLFVLTRDLQVKCISGPVEDTLAANPVVTSVVLHPNAGRVYVTCVPTETSFAQGVRLVWDYANGGVWSTDQVFDADTSQTSAGARHAWVANNGTGVPAYYWATSAGRVYRETNGVGAAAYLDGAQWVTMTYQSAWLKPSLSGFARFWHLQLSSTSLTPSDLTLSCAFDFFSSYNESHFWSDTQQAAFNRFPNVDVDVLVGNQKAKSIQFTLTDATPTSGSVGTGQGPTWQGVSLDIGAKEGRYQNLPPGQR